MVFARENVGARERNLNALKRVVAASCRTSSRANGLKLSLLP